MKYILDTNIISAIMEQNENVTKKVQEAILRGDDIFINCITYYEVIRGLLVTKAEKKSRIFEELCTEYDFLLLDKKCIFDKAAEIYGRLRNDGKTVKDADILIASLVEFHDSVLVTDNTRHFKGIEGLKLENWLN